ncbi:MAG: response regulator [Deltaproteobacteria bacterium]|nr:response regulator [Deltaproteobacteria bacterium]
MEQIVSENGSVLVVDDNPLIVNVLKSLLGSAGYQVFTSTNGEEALDCLGQKSVDVIICDVMMPRMDGYELHHKVRDKSELSHIPFLFLTALSDNLEVHRGKEIGADDYLVKPFDPHALLAVVRGKVARSRNLKTLSEEKYDSYRKKVIHTLSHEFRTPLVAINTGTELLLEQQGRLDGQKMLGLLEAIRRGGQRLERLVNDFMLMQQIEAGIAAKLFATRACPRAVAEMLTQFVEGKSAGLAEEGFSIEFNNLCREAEVMVYEPHIHDILSRLVSNAVKFSATSPTHHIEICAYMQEQEVVIEVRDRGIGIDPAKVRQAIDVFGQIDREKLEQQGGGLGLAIASRYAAINKGRLEFESRSGGGTTVSLTLPVRQK